MEIKVTLIMETKHTYYEFEYVNRTTETFFGATEAEALSKAYNTMRYNSNNLVKIIVEVV
jgi:hypothetical protein